VHDLSRVILGIALAAATGGCYAPTPSCSEGPANRELRFAQNAIPANASCAELCAKDEGVERVRSCEAPSLEPTYASGASEWIVRCEVDEVSCHEPAIIPEPSFGSGRRPEGYAPRGRARGAGPWLAAAARLEAASVDAFERLARELAHHGAPRALVRTARAAMRDEVRHARAMGVLARRHGGQPRGHDGARLLVRPRVLIAEENAREGCVGETVGAIVAFYQAARAADPAVRRVMRAIARDEARHAILSWRVAAWLDEDAEARAAAAHARHEALAALDAAAIAARSEDEATLLGLPRAREAARIVALARAELRPNSLGTASAASRATASARALLPPPSSQGSTRADRAAPSA
jgi:hypothetical protein